MTAVFVRQRGQIEPVRQAAEPSSTVNELAALCAGPGAQVWIEGAPCEFVLRFDLTGYPVEAPTRRPGARGTATPRRGKRSPTWPPPSAR